MYVSMFMDLKLKKSKLCQKIQGKTELFFDESSKIIEYYGVFSKRNR